MNTQQTALGGRMRIAVMLMLVAHAASADTITAYCACPRCCGPKAKGITAAGTKPVQGRTIAAPRNVPLGTRVRVEGLPGVFIVEDRTAKRFDGRWDLFFKSHKDALAWGKRELKVTRE